jgi:hypothetical protein
MPSDYVQPTDYSDLPGFLATREGEAQSSQFSTDDYGEVGDQRPYQVVFPSYPAPKFMARYQELKEALNECGTLCQLTGKPFRLVKWGSRLPCYPCNARKTLNKLPSVRITSPGALHGYPSAQPIADFNPRTGTIVYGPNGQPTIVGAPNFKVTRNPNQPGSFVDWDTPIPQRYLEAVKTAQYIASTTGRNAYLCSSMGASCKSRNPKKWIPVVYVTPGGLVARYSHDLRLPKGVHSKKGSTSVVNPVTADEFRELFRESEGRTRLGQGH